jgi:TATA-box binding protein (TBP) (component of TFIID and TFIIIB)
MSVDAKPTISNYKRTGLRISTMTATNNGLSFDLPKLFRLVPQILIPLWWPGEGILKFEHRAEVVGESHRDALTHRKITNKSFFNQSTLVVRRWVSDERGWKEVNIKLFGNGSVQMTGIHSEEFAEETLRWLIKECEKLSESPFNSPPTVNKMNVQMINSDFSLGVQLHSEIIHAILRDYYGLFSIFEKTLYQGVDTKYYYNTKKNPTASPGVCGCPTMCSGQGNADGEGQCKRITISIFQTGNIIITGARNMDQINEAYDFINKVFDKHEKEIVLVVPPTPVVATKTETTTVTPATKKPAVKRKPRESKKNSIIIPTK